MFGLDPKVLEAVANAAAKAGSDLALISEAQDQIVDVATGAGVDLQRIASALERIADAMEKQQGPQIPPRS